jgi:glycosyltransferase involved in cell wall biosynthesis
MPLPRILHVVPSLDQSGAEKQLALVAMHLPRDQFDVQVAVVTRGGYFEDVLTRAGVPVHVIGKRLKFDPWTLSRLHQLITTLAPDIVHTWMFGGNTYGRCAAWWAGVPRIIASERCVDEWKSGYHLAIDRFLLRWTDRVVVNAKAIGQFYAERGVAADRIVTIPNAIEPVENVAGNPASIRTSLGLKADVPTIGFIGRLWPQKRVQDLIWAADILRMSGWQFQVLIVGDGPRRTALERFADQLEIRPIVHFLGHRSDATRLMSAIDILALPSKFEGLPNVVLEAMMASKPVVATRIGGTNEVVVEDVTGVLVPVRDPLGLARGLRRLLAEPDVARQMGEAGRQRAIEHYSVAALVDRYARLYEEVLNAPARLGTPTRRGGD